jgi:hypothetical protein
VQLHDLIANRESTEISRLLCRSILRGRSSVELGWKNFVIERRTILPGEAPEVTLPHHFLILWDAYAEGESAYRRGQFSSYRKRPNTITTCVPGIRPAVRSRFEHHVIVGALHPLPNSALCSAFSWRNRKQAGRADLFMPSR